MIQSKMVACLEIKNTKKHKKNTIPECLLSLLIDRMFMYLMVVLKHMDRQSQLKTRLKNAKITRFRAKHHLMNARKVLNSHKSIV